MNCSGRRSPPERVLAVAPSSRAASSTHSLLTQSPSYTSSNFSTGCRFHHESGTLVETMPLSARELVVTGGDGSTSPRNGCSSAMFMAGADPVGQTRTELLPSAPASHSPRASCESPHPQLQTPRSPLSTLPVDNLTGQLPPSSTSGHSHVDYPPHETLQVHERQHMERAYRIGRAPGLPAADKMLLEHGPSDPAAPTTSYPDVLTCGNKGSCHSNQGNPDGRTDAPSQVPFSNPSNFHPPSEDAHGPLLLPPMSTFSTSTSRGRHTNPCSDVEDERTRELSGGTGGPSMSDVCPTSTACTTQPHLSAPQSSVVYPVSDAVSAQNQQHEAASRVPIADAKGSTQCTQARRHPTDPSHFALPQTHAVPAEQAMLTSVRHRHHAQHSSTIHVPPGPISWTRGGSGLTGWRLFAGSVVSVAPLLPKLRCVSHSSEDNKQEDKAGLQQSTDVAPPRQQQSHHVPSTTSQGPHGHDGEAPVLDTNKLCAVGFVAPTGGLTAVTNADEMPATPRQKQPSLLDDEHNRTHFTMRADPDLIKNIPRGKVPRESAFSTRAWSMQLLEHKRGQGSNCPRKGGDAARRKISASEVAQHNSPEDMWMVIRGVVYDCTAFQKYHPGGSRLLRECAGKDATVIYDAFHPWVCCESMLACCVKGVLDTDSVKHLN